MSVEGRGNVDAACCRCSFRNLQRLAYSYDFLRNNNPCFLRFAATNALEDFMPQTPRVVPEVNAWNELASLPIDALGTLLSRSDASEAGQVSAHHPNEAHNTVAD